MKTGLASSTCRRVLAVAALCGACASGVSAQGSGTLITEENFRLAPNGEILGRLQPGASLEVVSTRDSWLEVDLVGWVWTRSLQVTERGGFDLMVSEPEGENIRSTPQGIVVGQLGRGTLLEELAREPGWIQVRRRGFVWGPSVDVAESEPSTTDLPPPPDSPLEEPVPEATAAATRPGGLVVSGRRGLAVLNAPNGDTLAVTAPRSELSVTAREGNWVRVKLEGWAWMPEQSDSIGEASDTVVLTPAHLAREPDGYKGRMVSWRVQYVSLERAEAVRTDFLEGEPFLLCRFGGVDGPFVYVAVPPERVSEVEGLLPLEFLSVTGRVRTGASALTGTPIIDLLDFERARPRR